MKRSNPPRKHIVLYCSQSSQTQATTGSESETELSDFPPIRVKNSAPLFAPTGIRRATREASQPLPGSLGEAPAPPLSQRRQQPSAGLGQSNIVNTVSETAPARRAKVMPHILCWIPTNCEPIYQGVRSHPGKSAAKYPSSSEDADDERSWKRQRLCLRDEIDMTWVQDEITGVRESLERIATEAREDRQEISNTLQELLDEVRQTTWTCTYY